MRPAPLPVEFADLESLVQFVQKKSVSEYASTCPQCGGSAHPDGEWPDRFVLLLQSNCTGGAFGFCRRCDFKWWPGKRDKRDLDPETLKELERQATEYRERMESQRKAKLAQFTTQEIWEELHRRLQDEQRAWWRAQGVPDAWQDYLRLGYTPDRVYKSKNGELYNSPAYTIPYFWTGWEFKTMQYRLCDPHDPADRYRFESDLGSWYYTTTPSLPVASQVIVCEGAKKAIVTKVYGNIQHDTTVLAVPSKVDWQSCGLLEALVNRERVWIVFDPDCWQAPPNAPSDWTPQPVKLARRFPKVARVVELAVKVDDAFLHYGLDQEGWKMLLKQAMRA